MQLIHALNWRYAVKRMNGNKVPQEKVDTILEATRLSASSFGLQPYKILVIENEALRKQIQQVAYNQPQITECSHLLVFAAYDDITEASVEEYINHIAKVRDIATESLNGFRSTLLNVANTGTKEQHYQWAARQTYIAFGTAIVAAAGEEVDATPMEGFNAEALDTLLHLKEQGLRSVTLLALGYRNTDLDVLSRAKKVRKKTEDMFVKVA